jgi:hypothetical protein
VRRSFSIVLGVLATMLAAPSTALAYEWPLKPFDAQHAIRGYFNDPRREYLEGELLTSFHFGIDIVARDDQAVYSVSAGRADLREHSLSISPDGRWRYGYWHVEPTVKQGEVVEAGQQIGRASRGWGHVHFAESVDGIYLNPLRPGGIAPFVDTTTPTIASISMLQGGKPVDLRAVSGAVDLTTDAFDTPPLAPPPPWRNTRLTPALVRWRILAGPKGSKPVVGWRTAFDFRFALLPNTLFTSVYAPDTRQNRASKPGRYSFYLAQKWSTSRLRNGTYRLQVGAWDSQGNSAFALLPFTVAHP